MLPGITLAAGGVATSGDVFGTAAYWVVYVAGVHDKWGGLVYGGNEWQVRRALEGHVEMSGAVVDCVAYPFSQPIESVLGRETIENYYRRGRRAA